MINLAANLTWLFTEVPLTQRFEAAARAGFKGVEMLFPYELPAARVRDLLDASGLELVLFNLPPGNYDAGERGLAGLPGREADFAASVALGREYARVCGCARVHAMAGRIPRGESLATCTDVYVANLRLAARAFAEDGVTLTIEPLNSVENPTYLLQTIAAALATIQRVREPNLSLQLDLYHAQIGSGDLERTLRTLAGRYAHVQIAGNPHRNEPDAGEVNYYYLLDVLEQIGFEGWIGCEYRPRGETVAGLRWARRYGIRT